MQGRRWNNKNERPQWGSTIISVPEADSIFLGIAGEVINFFLIKKEEKKDLERQRSECVEVLSSLMVNMDFFIRHKIVSEYKANKALKPILKLMLRSLEKMIIKIPKIKTGELETAIYSYLMNIKNLSRDRIYKIISIILVALKVENDGPGLPERIRTRIKNKQNIKPIDINNLKKTLETISKLEKKVIPAHNLKYLSK